MWKWRVVLLGLLVLLFWSRSVQAADHVTFHLSFDKGLEPEVALGVSVGKYLVDGEEPQFTPGLKGQGFLTGKENQAVIFPAKGNVSEEEGSVVFWMKGLPGVTWSKADGLHYSFFNLNGGDGSVMLYKYYQYAHTWLLSEHYTPERQRVVNSINLPKYAEDQWHLFAFAWKGQKMGLYLDAELAGVKEDFVFPAFTEKSSFTLGQCMGKGTEKGNRIMDELTIYNKALSEYDLAAICRTQGEFATGPQVRLGKTKQKIKIDGKIEAGEWQDAVAIPIAIDTGKGQVTDTISQVLATYDDANLYLALNSPLPESDLANPYTKLLAGFFRKDRLTHDENVDTDDAFEINVIPNPGQKDGGDYYRMVVNPVDTTYDYVVRATGAIELKWDPAWKVKSTVDVAGWHLEAQIPFAAFGTGAPVEGTAWRVNFYRLWQLLRVERDGWAYGCRDRTDGSLTKYAMGTLVFGGEKNVNVRSISLGALYRGDLDLKMGLASLGGADQSAKVLISSEKGVIKNEELVLKPAQSGTFALQEDLTQKNPLVMNLEVSDPSGKTVYSSMEIPLFLKKELSFFLRSYPSTHRLQVEGDFSRLAIPPSEISGELAIQKEGKTLKSMPFKPQSTAISEELNIAELAVGHYDVLLSLQRGGKVIAKQKLPFEKKPMPEWLGNSLGKATKVPAPWSPMELKDKDIVCSWGRQYAYGNKLLPVQITTQGKGILARPVSLLVETGDKAVDLNAQPASMTLKGKTDLKVEWQKQVMAEGLKVEASSYTEFDGMNWTVLKLAPAKGKVNVRSLVLSIPLKKDWATLINPYDYSLRSTGLLKANGWFGPLRPLWLGNETGGVQFFAESSLNWKPRDRARELEVIPGKDEVVLKVNLVNVPFSLEGEQTFGFGYEATPVRPPSADYRKWRIGGRQYVLSVSPEKNTEVLELWTTGWAKVCSTVGEVSYPVPRADLTPGSFDARTADGRKCFGFPYVQLCQTWAESEEFKQFGNEWLGNIHEIYAPPSTSPIQDRSIGVCPAASSFQDFMLWGWGQLLARAHPRGYYLDVSNPMECNNLHHGCGIRVAGGVQTRFNILGHREMVKRMYTQLKESRPDAMIAYHNSGLVIMPALGFADLIVDGENHYSQMDRKENRGYEKFLGLATFRAEYMGHNFGPQVALLPQFTRSGAIRKDEAAQVGPQHQEYLHGLILLHDSQIWLCTYLYDDAVAKRLYSALDRYNFAGAPYEFIPYWNQTVTQPLKEDDAVVSFYVDRTKKRALAVVMNMNGQERNLGLTLDLQKLGLNPAKVSVTNACHSEKTALSGSQLSIERCPSHTYRLIALEEN